MNTNHLKKFAQEARRKLLEQVGAKLNFVLTTDSAELREKTEQLKQLRQELGRTTKEQLIEKVAYTWFNRLMALRFMDMNDYQPLGIRVITPKDGYTIPELLDEAKRGNIPEELKVNRQKIFELLDGKISSANPQNEAFKELVISACNHLNTTFPFLFEKINDYTELLLPNDLTSDFSIVKDVCEGMPMEDCQNVEIIGWLYQFYISEKKDEVFAKKTTVKKEDIPAATQLFTPRWIVEYMVQNTLGKLWLQNRSNSRLKEHMPYFVESASFEDEEYIRIKSPEEIKLLDPACGSGHILVYAFDLLCKIYEEEGYNTSVIPKLIIQNNLCGYEIDERAAQLSALALLMKAREYNRRVFHKELNPNILCFTDLLVDKEEIKELLDSIQIKVSNELMHDLLLMQQATNLGSLIIPHTNINEIGRVLDKLNQFLPHTDVFQREYVEALIGSLNHLKVLEQKFNCVVANPPYMGSGNMNSTLSNFVKFYYPDSKTDLMACFIESGLGMLEPKGFMGMINQHSWMFLGSYEKLRINLLNSLHFDTLLHLGARTFPEIGGEVVQNTAFTIWKVISKKNGVFFRLLDFENSEIKRIKTLEAIRNSNCGWYYKVNQKSFTKITSCPFGYWLNDSTLTRIFNSKQLISYGKATKGLDTCDNERFVRYWFEVSWGNISLKKSYDEKWYIYHKGGEFRKWYGNNEKIVNWQFDGSELRNFRNRDGSIKSRPQNVDKYFQNGITWSAIGSTDKSYRILENSIFGGGGNGFFPSMKNAELLLGYLNSKVSRFFLDLFNPTLNNLTGDLHKVPVVFESDKLEVTDIIKQCIEISKEDWRQNEWTYEFTLNDIIKEYRQSKLELEEVYDLYCQKWQTKFFQIHNNEEALNSYFIKIFEIQSVLNVFIPLEDISILQDVLDRRLLTKLNQKLERNLSSHIFTNYTQISLPFVSKEILMQFLSYSVGCMLGRYSLDKHGLILANQGETIKDFLHKTDKTKEECSFLPDFDNIIPILEGDWFEDDVVGKFYQFLKVSFGEKNFNKNLAFIEEQIGKDIRKYFIKDFYNDHIKRYKKRPIYWMFSSPKGSFNVLIYMHRYTLDTVGNILNKYLKEYIGKLNTRKEHLERVKETGSASDKSKAIKESDSIQKMLVELHEYERDILYPLATERIEIDLDDGVLANYNKFGKAVKEVNGLNDPATKKKVKQFDWIDTTQIR